MDRLEYQLLAKLRTNPPPTSETKIKLIEEKDAQGDAALAYQYFRDQTGRQDVPGILKCFGINPAFVRQMVDISASLLFNEGHLSRRQKELIATWISQLNACAYCADSHAFFLVAHGATKETAQNLIAGNFEDAGLSESEAHLLRYLEQVNKTSFKTSRSDVLALIASGWREEQVAEAVHVAAMLGFCNTVANAFGLPTQNMMALLDSAAAPATQKLPS